MKLQFQLVMCADAFISFVQDGQHPVPEIVNGKETGRIEHTILNENEIVLVFKDKRMKVSFFEGPQDP